MKTVRERVWVFITLVVLALGIVAVFTGQIMNDTGWGALWYLAVMAMAFPLGAIFLYISSALLGFIEIAFLGTDTYFAPLAQVCFAWSSAFAGGLVQRALIDRWRSHRASKSPDNT